MIKIKPIRNDEDLHGAVERINALFGCPANTPEADELEVLMVLVEEYEDRVHPVDEADPIGVIKERMKDLDLAPKDLVPAIGHRSTVSEILTGRRSLTVRMIQNLSELLRVPPQALFPCKERKARSA